MKRLALLVVTFATLIAGVGIPGAADKAQEDLLKKEWAKLKGTWRPVSTEANGKKTPENILKDNPSQIVIEEGRITGSLKDKETYQGTLTIDPTQTPKTLDIAVTSGDYKGKKSLGIYELDGDTLKLCWTFFIVDRDRPKTFATETGANLILTVYQRVKK